MNNFETEMLLHWEQDYKRVVTERNILRRKLKESQRTIQNLRRQVHELARR